MYFVPPPLRLTTTFRLPLARTHRPAPGSLCRTAGRAGCSGGVSDSSILTRVGGLVRYYELLEKDTVKFGNSTREYVLLNEGSV